MDETNTTLADSSTPLDVQGGALFPNTGGQELGPEPKIQTPRVDTDMDAGELGTALGGDKLDLPEVPPTSLNIDSVVASANSLLQQVETEKADRLRLQEQQVPETTGIDTTKKDDLVDDLTEEIQDPIDRTELQKTELEKNLETLGVDMQEFTTLASEVAVAKGNLDRLNAQELAVVEDARLRGETTGFASGQVVQEQRRFAVQRAGLSAELGAKAALLQALQGNFELAESMTESIVKNAVADKQDRIDNLDLLLDIESDIIDDNRKAIEEERKRTEDEKDELESDMRDKLRMINSDPRAAKAAGYTSLSSFRDVDFEEFSLNMSQHKTIDTGITDDGINLSTTAKTKLLGSGFSVGDIDEIERSVNSFGIEATLKAIDGEERRASVATAYSAEEILNIISEGEAPAEEPGFFTRWWEKFTK